MKPFTGSLSRFVARLRLAVLATAGALFLGACSMYTPINGERPQESGWNDFYYDLSGLPAEERPEFPRVCYNGDTVVSSAAECFSGDNACYQTDDGQWCTGERSTRCPAGSDPIAPDEICPDGAVCWVETQGLHCMSDS
ncbi:hypothetical protein [Biformimicrobium ophioploci]|uniref:Lipoprotein n=1 Tax=Biformimicrobium ophioploci TaxID=3036711 RepID=A0ABQ6LZ11_9GAMM|nr:hypothetical protein [Microbulbifer sp. NKW57]GMG87267.1 hypothetical protein MNKW57_15880 [Microbulbifer sp. NKW57]